MVNGYSKWSRWIGYKQGKGDSGLRTDKDLELSFKK